jgi:hypothetical protein
MAVLYRDTVYVDVSGKDGPKNKPEVRCYFDEQSAEQLFKLGRDEPVRVKGVCKGYNIWVQLERCELTSGVAAAKEKPNPKTLDAPPVKVEAKELYRRYRDDKVASESELTNKLVEVVGRVHEIRADRALVQLKGQKSVSPDVECYFDPEDAEQLARLSKDQAVKLRGVCYGLRALVEVRHCEIVE